MKYILTLIIGMLIMPISNLIFGAAIDIPDFATEARDQQKNSLVISRENIEELRTKLLQETNRREIMALARKINMHIAYLQEKIDQLVAQRIVDMEFGEDVQRFIRDVKQSVQDKLNPIR